MLQGPFNTNRLWVKCCSVCFYNYFVCLLMPFKICERISPFALCSLRVEKSCPSSCAKAMVQVWPSNITVYWCGLASQDVSDCPHSSKNSWGFSCSLCRLWFILTKAFFVLFKHESTQSKDCIYRLLPLWNKALAFSSAQQIPLSLQQQWQFMYICISGTHATVVAMKWPSYARLNVSSV